MKIRIKKKNRGKFTALLKRTGKSASWFKAHGTPLQRKRATFALNARKWKHGDGGFLENYYDDGGPYGVIPLGGDYLSYLQSIPEVYGGDIEPSVVTAALPAKFNGSQEAARRYAEGYLYGAKPVSEAMNRAGQKIFNTVDTVVGLTPTPAGALTWLGHMGADTMNGEYGKVGRDAAMAAAMGLGLRAAGKGVSFLRNYWDEIGNFGEDTFRAFTDRVPGKVSTNFTYEAPKPSSFESGFWSNKALGLMAKNGNAEAADELASRPYEIENLGGGYMLKSLMRGNPLEKQISKQGTVNVNNVKALSGKGSKVEQAVIDKVLASEEFAGKKSIDYNKFRKAVQDELITYDRTPNTKWSDYGLDRIGLSFGNKTDVRNAEDRMNMLRERIATGKFKNGEKLTESDIADAKSELEKMETFWRQIPEAETYTFSSSRIPGGSAKHYGPNTLGHSRTYTTADEPDVLHVMESQSDWAQKGGAHVSGDRHIDEEISDIEDAIARRRQTNPNSPRISYLENRLNNTKLSANSSDTQANYLADNFTSRQIQENLRYAAEKGQKKMRYPTRETAAKIEGYPGEDRILYFDKNGNQYNDPLNEAFELDKEIESLRAKLNKEYDNYAAGDISARDRISELTNKITEMPEKPKKLKEGVVTKTITTYQPGHEGILKKYDAFPKQYKKLYKNADVRIVTDPKGNTWYEVDVPENYLQQEWAYEEGGSMILPKMMMDKHSPDKLRKAIASIKAKRMN